LTPESALYLTTLTESFRRMDAATGSLRDARRDRPLRIMCSGNVATRWLFPTCVNSIRDTPTARCC
jgi:LysR family glycine cleavage system transcriptional activator